MQERDRLARMVRDALDMFDTSGKTVAGLVRLAARIASLRKDFPAQYRFQLELLDVSSGTAKEDKSLAAITTNLNTLLGSQGAREQVLAATRAYSSTRKINGTDNFHAVSIAQVEANYARLQKVYDEYSVADKGSSFSAQAAAQDADAKQAVLLGPLQNYSDIIERVRQSVYDYLLTAESELQAGTTTATPFERGMEYLRSALAERSPAALEKLTAAEASLEAGTPEDLSHALTSARRMLKDVADALYPPTDEVIVGDDKVERVMSEDAYRNRLIQFAKEHVESRLQGKVMADTLRSYGQRLTNLDSLASKGVHGEVSRAEAEQCVMWTFMLTTDLLRIADGTSLDLAANNSGETNP